MMQFQFGIENEARLIKMEIDIYIWAFKLERADESDF